MLLLVLSLRVKSFDVAKLNQPGIIAFAGKHSISVFYKIRLRMFSKFPYWPLYEVKGWNVFSAHHCFEFVSPSTLQSVQLNLTTVLVQHEFITWGQLVWTEAKLEWKAAFFKFIKIIKATNEEFLMTIIYLKMLYISSCWALKIYRKLLE